MKFIFRDSETEVVLPVTPKDFEVSGGKRIELVNVHAVGDAAIGGTGKLGSMKVACMFPARRYAFAQGDAAPPYEYVEQFEKWAKDPGAVVRWIITGTPVNVAVLVEEIRYGEKDGTGDVYATLTLREHRHLAVAQTQKAASTGNLSREESAPPRAAESYTVAAGDTLSAIARKFYGDASLCYALAAYNGIKNANLIYVGQTLQLPDRSLLGEAAAPAPVPAPAPAAQRGGGGTAWVMLTK